MDEVYLYTVNPRRVITGITGVNAIRVAKSLYLTKDDVYTCLKSATVYRRFSDVGINERVTIANVDRVHRANYISEADWEKFQAEEMSKGHATVKEVVVPEKKETKKEEAPVVEEKVEEVVVPEVVEEKPVVEEVVEEAPVEEVEPATEEEEETVESDDEAVENQED